MILPSTLDMAGRWLPDAADQNVLRCAGYGQDWELPRVSCLHGGGSELVKKMKVVFVQERHKSGVYNLTYFSLDTRDNGLYNQKKFKTTIRDYV
jgi:hypothetical protein